MGECALEGIADPLEPDALCKAVNSGCLHCIISVISAREMAKGLEPLQAVGALMQVVSEIAASGVVAGKLGEAAIRTALVESVGELFDEAVIGLREGDIPRSEH